MRQSDIQGQPVPGPVRVHRPNSGLPDDVPFLQAQADYAKISIRVEGQYNWSAFTYGSDLMDDQEIRLRDGDGIED